jgi:hypothetical protein
VREFRSIVLTVLACAMTGAACTSAPPATSSNPLKPTTFYDTGVAAFVESTKTVAAAPIAGSKQAGHPVAGTDGLTVTATAPPNVVNGGGTIVTLHGSAPFSKVLISVVNAGTAVDGYYTIDLGAAHTDQDVLVRFVQSLPAATFDIRFQAVSPAGAVSQPGTFSATVASDATSLIPSVIASYSPSPAPFQNGVPCAITGQLGCLWEFKVLLQEFNGIAVNPATLTETYTFASGATVTDTAPIIIPGNGIGTAVRNIACGSPTISCVPPEQLAGGTYTFSVTGTDFNGNPFTFTGPVLTLLGR